MAENRKVEALYLYAIISILMIINVVLYSVTAYRIWTVQKETSVIRNGDSQRHSKMDADTDRQGSANICIDTRSLA
jgi:G protein-coupled receptor Mth (Methuselah protein)